MSKVNLNQFDNRETLFDAVTKEVAMELNRSVEKCGMASFVVPGGTTPAPIFDRLSNISLLWHNISVLPSDERWLNASHPASNENLVRTHLTKNKAKQAKVVALKTDDEHAEQAVSELESRIAELGKKLSVVMLGMGNDGHFASLFPNSDTVEEGLDLETGMSAVAVNATGCPVAGEYTERVSLTLRALTDSKKLLLVILGEEKKALISDVLAGRCSELPIAALLKQDKVPVDIYWAA